MRAAIERDATMRHQPIVDESDLFSFVVRDDAETRHLAQSFGRFRSAEIAGLRARGDGARQRMHRTGRRDCGERKRAILIAVEGNYSSSGRLTVKVPVLSKSITCIRV